MSIAEEWIGAWCAIWFESLTKYYGLSEGEAYYFRLHAEADSLTEHGSGDAIGHEIMGHGQSHRYVAVRMLEDGLLTPEEMRQMVMRSAGADSYVNFLDALYHTYHPAKKLSEIDQTRR
jgi:pyrroloquinoline quinone (PQQ) biosynthesis protein C